MHDWLQRDSVVKALSVVIAVFLWFQVMTEENPVEHRTFEGVPITVEGVQPGFVVLEYEPKTANVVIRGARRSLSALTRDLVKVKVKLDQASEGSETVPIEVGLPSGCELAQVVPSLVTVAVDVVVSRPVRVSVDVSGEPSEDFEILAPSSDPSSVTASGPKTKVQLVEAAWGKVEVTGTTADVTSDVRLVPVTAEGREVSGVTLMPQSSKVVVPVNALPPSKMVLVRASVTGLVAPGYKISGIVVEPAYVKIRAPAEVLSGMTGIATGPVAVDGADSSITKEVSLVVPPEVTSVSARTVRVTANVVEDLTERAFASVPVTIRNLSAGLDWKISPSLVRILATGRRDLVEKLQGREIEAFVDAEGLSAGDHRLPVGVRLKGVSDSEKIAIAAEPEEVLVQLGDLP